MKLNVHKSCTVFTISNIHCFLPTILHLVENRCARFAKELFIFHLGRRGHTQTFSVLFRMNHTIIHAVVEIQKFRDTSKYHGNWISLEIARIASYFHFCCEFRKSNAPNERFTNVFVTFPLDD